MEVDNMNDLGNKINILRGEKGWSLNELSSRSGIPVSTLHGIEKGSNPSFEKIKKLAEVFNVSTDYLINKESYDKKASRTTYNNMTDDRLIKLFNLNEENFKLLSIDNKKEFIEQLSNVEPYKVKLNNLLNNFDNLTKKDLVDICNDIKQHYITIIDTFISNDYKTALDIIKLQHDHISYKDEIIKKYDTIWNNIFNNSNPSNK